MTARTLAPSPDAAYRDDTRAHRPLRRHRMAALSGLALVGLILIALLAPLIAPYAYDRQDLAYPAFPAPPDARHWLGTDTTGQDVLSRLLYGARVSLGTGVLVELLQVVLGVSLGLLAAARPGLWDTLLMRLTDAMFAFPGLLFAILLIGIFPPTSPAASVLTVFIALALVSWPGMARLARGQALALREQTFVEAARALGMGETRIVFRHLLPNMLAPLLVAVTVDIGGVILAEATLSFLGIGIQPPYPSWGRMISDAMPHLRSTPLLLFCPSLLLAITVMAFNFLGDALRDLLDPRLRNGG